MKKAIYFDMDGTIANLYGVNDWLASLINEDATPYKVARPLLSLSSLARKLNKLQRKGYTIGIISWLSKNSSDSFAAAVTEAKLSWLSRHLPSVKWDEIHIVSYGTNKRSVATAEAAILFDDEENNRKIWGAGAHNEKNILDILATL